MIEKDKSQEEADRRTETVLHKKILSTTTYYDFFIFMLSDRFFLFANCI